jgi:hypothetical protein
MTDETRQKWEEINAFLNPKPADPAVPLPAQANRAAMTPAQQEATFNNWVEFIDKKPINSWQPDEVAAYRFAAQRALKEIGR